MRLANPADAEDAVQEAFLRAIERLGTLHDRAKFGPWLLTIARHEAVRIDARGKTTVGAAESPRESATEPDPARVELGEMVRERVADLPELSRDVLMLHYFAGHTSREIADLLGVTQSAVLKRLERARGQLAESMLHDLEATRPSEDSIAKQRGRILAVTSGTTIPSAVATSTVAAASGILSVPAFTKLFSVAAGLVLVGTVFFAVNLRRSLGPEHASASSVPEPTPTAMASIASDSDATSADTSVPAARFPVAQRQADSAAEPSVGSGAENSAGVDPNLVLLTEVTLEAEQVHIAAVLSQLEDSFGLKFLIDSRAVGLPVYAGGDEPAPRTVPYATSGMLAEVDFREMRLSDALQRMANELGLQAVLEPGYVWISTRENIAREVRPLPRDRFEAYDTEAVLENLATAQFRDVHIKDALDFFTASYDLNIALDQRVIAPPGKPAEYVALPQGKVTRGMIDYIHLKDIEVRDMLAAFCRILDVVPVLHADYIWLSSAEQVRRDGLVDAPAGSRQRIDAAMTQPASVVFEDISFRDISDFINGTFKLYIALDQGVVAWENEPRGASPVRDGIPADTLSHGMPERVTVQDLPFRTYLEVLTRQVDLEFEVRGDAIIVSNRDRLRGGIAPGDLVGPDAFPAIVPPATPPDDPSEPQGEADQGCDEILLRNVQMASDGLVRAVFEFCGVARVYAEGDAFDHYTVVSIDLESKCVTLFDQELPKEIEMCA